ncbi:MAG: UvrD-helicase domain-containing protein, partial [Candidatus Woesearchaeota archaeon]
MSINKEKQDIIAIDGNVLVTANPGTGKTLLLAHKYVDLLQKGVKPEEILCLTFTNKAKREMESRILDVIKESGVDVDYSKLNVFTFHSYALDNIEDSEVISSNLIRYAIYKYLRDNEVLNYPDSYLVDTIVPKIESLMRYLKNFGILPWNIDIDAVKPFIDDSKNFEKAELEGFLVHFKNMFEEYERVKSQKG